MKEDIDRQLFYLYNKNTDITFYYKTFNPQDSTYFPHKCYLFYFYMFILNYVYYVFGIRMLQTLYFSSKRTSIFYRIHIVFRDINGI